MNKANIIMVMCGALGVFGCEGRMTSDDVRGEVPGEPGSMDQLPSKPDGSATDPPLKEPVVEPVMKDEAHAPVREPVGSALYGQARQVQRMTSDQVRRSLEEATGEIWRDYEDFAGAMGRPDLTEVTEEGQAMNSTFVKILEDAARVSCDAAVEADLGRSAEARVILRHASATDTDRGVLSKNLGYLLLRFWAVDVDEYDERLEPWLNVLTAPNEAGEELNEDDRLERWKLVCVGLATHPNFLTY